MAGIVSYRFVRKLLSDSRIVQIANLEITSQNILDDLILSTLCQRSINIKLHNGGDKLYANVSKYISIIQEGKNSPLGQVIDDFQYYEVDERYMQMIQRLLKERRIILYTHEMPPGFLKRQYERDGITITILTYLSETDSGLYFNSSSSNHAPHDYLDSKNYAGIEIALNHMKNAYARGERNGLLR